MSTGDVDPVSYYNKVFGIHTQNAENYPESTTFVYQLSEAFDMLGRYGYLDAGIVERIQAQLHVIREKLGEVRVDLI